MSEQDTNYSNAEIDNAIEKEQRILAAMRKTLSRVVRDITPSSTSLKSPLSKSTTEDIVMCFGLITAREQELAKLIKSTNTQKPHFTDEVKTTQTVSLDSLKSTLNKPSLINTENTVKGDE